MSKFTKATKRIAAVAASAVIVSSAAFGAGLSSYPQNFVSNDKFTGKVVVGAAAQAIDTTSATSIINDLKSEFSGSSSKVAITYKSSASGGEELSAVRSNQALNYNETIGSVSETAGFDDQDFDALADGRFKNGVSDEDYEQKLVLSNGKFNYALKDEVTGITEIKDGVFYGDQDTFATYTLDLKTVINSAAWDDEDFIGEELSIMGNEFTIGEIQWTASNSGDLSKLVLLGGANKVSLGEGESTTVTIDGTAYEVSVQSASSDNSKVLLTVNGETKSIAEFDSEDIAGISVAVTDIVSSSRDSVKGYAEVVLGGQKITLEDGNKEVKVNDDDISDLYENYEVTSNFVGSDMDAIEITYKVGDDILLEAGDSLEDVLFQSFSLTFDGTNEPEYSEIKLTVDDDDLKVQGITEDNVDLSMNLLHMGNKNDGDTVVYLKGENDEDRILFKNSKDLTGLEGATSLAEAGLKNGTLAVFNLSSTGVKGSGVLISKDDNEQYLYTISSVDTVASGTHEVDLEEYLRADDESDIQITEWETKLGTTVSGGFTNGTDTITVDETKLANTIAYENEVLLSLAGAESTDLDSNGATLVFSLDTDDTDADGTEDAQTVTVTLGYDATDKEFDISSITSSAGFANDGDEDNKKSNSDVKTYVNAYGIKVEYDNDEKQSATIMVPEEQVEGMMTLAFGGSASSSMTVTVDSDAVDAKKAELEEDGYTVVKTEAVSSEAVEFDVTAPVLDTAVSGSSDMIVVGGPAVNKVAASLLGMQFGTTGVASGVVMDEAVIRYYADKNSVLVYGYEGKDTAAAAAKLNAGGLSGEMVNVQ